MAEGSGKGDSPRPKSISEKEYAKRFEKVFGKKDSYYDSKAHKKWVEEAKKLKNAR